MHSSCNTWLCVVQLREADLETRVTQLEQKLVNMKKLPGQSIEEYVNLGCSIKQELIAAGKVYEDDSELCKWILNGLSRKKYGTIKDLAELNPDLKINVIRLRVMLVKIERDPSTADDDDDNAKPAHVMSIKRDYSRYICHNCSEMGHIAKDCPKPLKPLHGAYGNHKHGGGARFDRRQHGGVKKGGARNGKQWYKKRDGTGQQRGKQHGKQQGKQQGAQQQGKQQGGADK